jgi:hypothetical protein
VTVRAVRAGRRRRAAWPRAEWGRQIRNLAYKRCRIACGWRSRRRRWRWRSAGEPRRGEDDRIKQGARRIMKVLPGGIVSDRGPVRCGHTVYDGLSCALLLQLQIEPNLSFWRNRLSCRGDAPATRGGLPVTGGAPRSIKRITLFTGPAKETTLKRRRPISETVVGIAGRGWRAGYRLLRAAAQLVRLFRPLSCYGDTPVSDRSGESGNSQVWPMRSRPKLRCGSSLTRRKPAAR